MDRIVLSKIFFVSVGLIAVSEWRYSERRLVGLKKRIEELRSQLEEENAEKEESKRLKETTEQELRGCEFEMAMDVTAIQTLEVLLMFFH